MPPDLRKECTDFYFQQKDAESERLKAQFEAREERMKRRREAVARALEEERAQHAANDGELPSKRKKKKKKNK
jgi:hypothetical protein